MLRTYLYIYLNTKIKTIGLKLILRELGYKTNVVVHPTDNGYRTTLIAINENCLFEIHLVLKDYLFSDQSKVYVRCFNTRTNQDWDIEQNIIYDDLLNQRNNIAMSIINAVEYCNKNAKLFSLFTLKEMYVALTDIKKIKEFYSLNERAYKIFKEIDNVM